MEQGELEDKQGKSRTARNLRLFGALLWRHIKSLINLTEDTDSETTISNITKGVEFKGDNIWVLFFAIIIASVGLNVNSTAVIIGAMLISPLMGPIMGVGLAIGVSDGVLLKKSLRNLLTMVVISLLASSLYFLITPLSDAQSELLARTKPTIFDVFIAFFGGAAGILASSRKQEKVTVVSGVAIATALMPPLCTAGYGIGTGQLMYFFGAFYLFFINSFFIALATYIMVRYLKFPRKVFMDLERERKVKRMIFIFSIIVIVPSVLIAFSVVKETSFNSQAIKYVSDIETSEVLSDVQIISYNRDYSSKGSSITLSLVGKPLSEKQVAALRAKLEEYGLKNTDLVIKQAAGTTLDVGAQANMLQDFIESKEKTIAEKDSVIDTLKNQILEIKQSMLVSSEQIAREMAVLYSGIESISFSNASSVTISDMKVEKLPTINIVWEKTPQSSVKQSISKWLSVRLGTDKIAIQHIIK